jgi:unsaturated rhamnogalacturonyl hydrolase
VRTAAALVASVSVLVQAQPASDREPLDVARTVAGRYPLEVSMRYVPALIWSGALRLTALTGEARWRDKALREMQPFIAGEKTAIELPLRLPSVAGHLALSDAGAAGGEAAAALARKAADLILAPSDAGIVNAATGWTDDMFMATSVLARIAARSGDDRYAQAAGRLLTEYAGKLQRPDGLFVHAIDGPHAWGRGNGFAALGVVDALTYLPASWPQRPAVLAIHRRHMSALLRHQAADGAWRQVIDEPAAYPELTATAMAIAAMARGVRLGWLDRTFVPGIERGWRAVLARVSKDGTLRDVCPSTGAGATKDHYLTRPAINGADDRGAAMVLLAALEVHELRAGRR